MPAGTLCAALGSISASKQNFFKPDPSRRREAINRSCLREARVSRPDARTPGGSAGGVLSSHWRKSTRLWMPRGRSARKSICMMSLSSAGGSESSSRIGMTTIARLVRADIHSRLWKSTTSLLLAVVPRWLAYHLRFGTERQILPSGALATSRNFSSANPACRNTDEYRSSCHSGSENATICTTRASLSTIFAMDLNATSACSKYESSCCSLRSAGSPIRSLIRLARL